MKHDEEIALRLLLIESGLTDEEVLTKVTDLVSRFAIAAYTAAGLRAFGTDVNPKAPQIGELDFMGEHRGPAFSSPLSYKCKEMMSNGRTTNAFDASSSGHLAGRA